jgi:eukaryotic-like serine/threonine-protein kinase
MSSVWLAERTDGQLKRPVALKLPHLSWSGGWAERMARERDILATLVHPHIARLYDAGVDQAGRPWLALEIVEGQPLDRHCQQQRLTVRARIELLLQACDAVAYAHSRLVIHRDLKPGNLLVTAEGRLLLLDFGIAKLLAEGEAATDATQLTREHGRAMTLAYASPEQVRAEPLSTASDQYSLAVVAFELLCGQRPYRLQQGTPMELERAVLEAPVPPASRIASDPETARQLRGDVDAILHRALKKDPAERYPTVAAFADDLRRHLADQPVLAQPDGLRYRAAKFVRRYRLQLAGAAVVSASLIGGTALALWQAQEARAQAKLAQQEAATAKAVQAFMQGVFRANSINQSDPVRARDTTARELLDRGAERIEADLAAAPAARLELHQTLGAMYDHMGLPQQALHHLRQRAALAEQLHGAGSTPGVIATTHLATQLLTGGRVEEAATLLQGAQKASVEAGNNDPLARFHLDFSLGSLYWVTDPPKALPAARRAVEAGRQWAPTWDFVNALQLVGDAGFSLGELEVARSALAEAAELIERHPEIGRAAQPMVLGTLADVQNAQGNPDAARSSYERALKAAADRPAARHVAAFKLANFYMRNDLVLQSLQIAQEGAVWGRRPEAQQQVGQLAASLVAAPGRALIAYGHLQEGLAVVDEALGMLEGQADVALFRGPLLAMKGDALVELGRYAQAEPVIEQAQSLIGDSAGQARLVLPVRRRLWLATGRAEQALADWAAQAAPPASADALAAPRRLAESAQLQWAVGHLDAARAQATEVLQSLEALPTRGFARAAEAQAALVLGQVALQQGRAQEALPMLQRAAALRRAVFDPARSLALADVLTAQAACHQMLGDPAAARVAMAEVRRIHGSHPSVGSQRVTALRELAAQHTNQTRR